MKHVKENDLAHGEFGKWLQSINMHHETANKMMKIANELNSNSYTYMNLGSRALYEIATLPEPEHAKGHSLSNDEPIKRFRKLFWKSRQLIKVLLTVGVFKLGVIFLLFAIVKVMRHITKLDIKSKCMISNLLI